MAIYLQSRAHSPTEQVTANCINYQPANSHNLYYMSWPTGRGSRRRSCCALNCATRRLSSMASPPSHSASMAVMPSSFSSALTQCARTNHVVGCSITNFDICNECGIGIPHLTTFVTHRPTSCCTRNVWSCMGGWAISTYIG